MSEWDEVQAIFEAALQRYIDLSESLQKHEATMDELDAEIRKYERFDRMLNPPPGTPRMDLGGW